MGHCYRIACHQSKGRKATKTARNISSKTKLRIEIFPPNQECVLGGRKGGRKRNEGRRKRRKEGKVFFMSSPRVGRSRSCQDPLPVSALIVQPKKFLQFDWFRGLVFQLNFEILT